ncbi:helix-turn-helix protein [Pseudoduganella flava]|uniref:Helix-turn-helix domain-containing protein n=1 Tax=Pseudoduganella flava TaxID=871742 RepID=A0A562PR72_9BURK|nr:helix-turn-helix domain-containing protein [Pseudoduganella flava]QGZ37756.1 helix-turn-helix domain-containing protein [Pseudoduganella flava]TWI46566.1 helix-turn-helix protein [Pseudoduganella flava]
MRTVNYLDAIKTRLNLPSDYALAKRLGITQQAISNYRAGRSKMDDDVALTIAELLGVNPLAVIAAANAERAKTDEQRERWTGIMEKFSASFRNLLSPWDGRERRAFARG